MAKKSATAPKNFVTTSNFTTVNFTTAFSVEAEEYFSENPLSKDFANEHQTQFLGGVLVPLNVILQTADTETFQQTEINPAKVKAIVTSGMTPDQPFQLLEPIQLGFDIDFLTDDGELAEGAIPHSVLGGRHRTAAIVAMLRFSGYSDEEIGEIELNCLIKFTTDDVHTAQLIMSSNGSRSMAPVERYSLKLQQVGVDITAKDSVDQIQTALSNKAIKRGEAVASFALAYRAGGESLGDRVDALSEGTYIKLATTMFSSIVNQLSGELKKIATTDGLPYVTEVCVGYLDAAIEEYEASKSDSKDAGNLQRNATKVVASVLRDALDEIANEFKATVEKMKAEKKARAQEQAKKLQEARKAAAATASKSSKASSTKKPKAKPVEEVEPEEADDDVEDEEETEVVEAPAKKRRPSAPKPVAAAAAAAPKKTRSSRRNG